MHFGDIGTLIWIVIIVAGVISSLRRSAQRSRAGTPAQTRPAPAQGLHAQFAARATPAAPTAAAPQRVVPQPVAPQPIRAAATPPPAAPRSARPAQPAPAAAAFAPAPPKRALGRFAGRHDLVRAVIASEILGKPRALRDEYDLLGHF